MLCVELAATVASERMWGVAWLCRVRLSSERHFHGLVLLVWGVLPSSRALG